MSVAGQSRELALAIAALTTRRASSVNLGSASWKGGRERDVSLSLPVLPTYLGPSEMRVVDVCVWVM